MTISRTLTSDEIQEPVCDCSNWEIRWRKDSLDRVYYCRQCLNCGRMIDQVGKKALAEPPKNCFDESLRQAWIALCSDMRQLHWEALHEEQREDYAENYLHSEHWRNLREQVLKRDGYRCQICGAPACDPHHLTYAHRGHEYLFELVSLCRECHIQEYHHGSEDAAYYE